MAVDLRATVTCSLGTLISGNLGDDYLQGNGLIKTRGSAVIAGTITPAIGTIVTFSYTKGGVTRNIPRKLRVLSSFADPYRRTTSVELGCKLTYLSDLRERTTWRPAEDPENASLISAFTGADTLVTLPIYVTSVMEECLDKLNLTAANVPLISKFTTSEFDFSPGYVQVMSDLLVSESYCGYLDFDEVLQFIDLKQNGGSGPVYTSNDIVDHGPLNSGQLPGDAVRVQFSTMQLRRPEAEPEGADPEDENSDIAREARLNWERSVTTSGPNTYIIGNRTYTGMETVVTETSFVRIKDTDVPGTIVTTTTGSTASIAGSIGTSYVKNNINFNATNAVLKVQTQNNIYDNDANLVRTETTVSENNLAIYGSLSLEYAFSPTSFVSFPISGSLIAAQRVITDYRRVGTVQEETTNTYVTWYKSIPGQQAIAEYRDSISSPQGVVEFLNKTAFAGLVHENTSTSINTKRTTPGRPANTVAAALSRDGDPANDYKAERVAELGWVFAEGTPSDLRRIEFTLPYSPDDTFGFIGDNPNNYSYSSVRISPSAAATTALNFGRIQNRLLLGNRYGMTIQLAPERLPDAPFAPMYVQANGLTAQYRANGNQWSFDGTGIVCSTDALFWAAVGGAGTFWFPVAPGVTTLPAAPTPVNGEINPTVTFPPYNEIVSVRAGIRTGIRVNALPYTLQPQLTVVDPLGVATGINVARIRKVTIPTTPAITLAALAPQVSISSSIAVPVANITIAALAPSVLTGASVPVPATSIAVTALAPAYIIRPKLLLPVPAATISLAAPTPSVASGASVAVGAVNIAVAALVPTSVGVRQINVAAITYSQSSLWSGATAASNAIMTDGSFTNTGTATNLNSPSWVRMDLGETYDVAKVVIGTATSNIPGGWDKSYTENRDVRYSTDGTSWTTDFNTSTFASDGIYTFNVSFSARYIEIGLFSGGSSYTALSEFYALSPGQTYP